MTAPTPAPLPGMSAPTPAPLPGMTAPTPAPLPGMSAPTLDPSPSGRAVPPSSAPTPRPLPGMSAPSLDPSRARGRERSLLRAPDHRARSQGRALGRRSRARSAPSRAVDGSGRPVQSHEARATGCAPRGSSSAGACVRSMWSASSREGAPWRTKKHGSCAGAAAARRHRLQFWRPPVKRASRPGTTSSPNPERPSPQGRERGWGRSFWHEPLLSREQRSSLKAVRQAPSSWH